MSTLSLVGAGLSWGVALIALIAWAMMRRPRDRFMWTMGALVALGWIAETIGIWALYHQVRSGWVNTLSSLAELVLVLACIQIDRPRLKRLVLGSGILGLVLFGYAVLRQEDLTLWVTQGQMFLSAVLSVALLAALWSRLEVYDGRLLDDPRITIYLGLLGYTLTAVPILGTTMIIWSRYPDLARNMFLMFQVMVLVRGILMVMAFFRYEPAYERDPDRSR
jgi:hypothetical protein